MFVRPKSIVVGTRRRFGRKLHNAALKGYHDKRPLRPAPIHRHPIMIGSTPDRAVSAKYGRVSAGIARLKCRAGGQNQRDYVFL